MILREEVEDAERLGAPRVSGDDPELATVLGTQLKCSPRERG